jgi:hypothetical protein
MKAQTLSRYTVIFLMSCLFLSGCDRTKIEWIPLFNGKDLNDWKVKIRGYAPGDNYGNTFTAGDGVLKVGYQSYDSFDNKFGHIFYKDKFSHYLLRLEYRFTGEQCTGGPGWAIRNSGAMVHSQSPESMGLNQDFPISLEVQFLGGNGTDPRTTGNLCTPGTHVVMNDKLVTDHCISSSSKTYHGDQWVSMSLLVLGDSILKHIIEEDTVLVYTRPVIGGGVVSDYDSTVKVDGSRLKEGYISLQSESHPIEFRNIELLDLQPFAHDKQKLNQVLSDVRSNSKD